MSKPLVHLWTNPGRVHPEPYNYACGATSFIVWSANFNEVTCEACLSGRAPAIQPGECYTIYKATLLKHLEENYTGETFKRQVMRIFEALK